MKNGSDLSNEALLAKILTNSGKPWLLDIMEAMEITGVTPEQLLRSLFFVGNIKRFSRWGQVMWIIQDGVLKIIKQEQQTKF